jgi:hypothetical protein
MVFEDHAETISGYLNWYKSSLRNPGIEEKRFDQSDKFSKYLVMACWRKMDRRITHWFSLGLVYHLAQITNKQNATLYDNFTMAASQLPDSSQSAKNRALRLHLQEQFDQEILADILGNHDDDPDQEGAAKLLRACSDETGGSLYTRDTAEAFHNLLVGTLITYARLLRDMKEYVHAKDWEGAAGPTTGGFLGMVRLLDVIVHSKAFDEHMELLQRSRCLELPSLQHRADYLRYTAKEGLIQAYAPHSGDSGGDDGDDEADGDDGDDEDDDQPEEQSQYSSIFPLEPSTVASRWIKLFVKHFVAKHRLEAHCRVLHSHGIKSAFEINILRVQKITDDMPSWEKVKSIIASAIQKHYSPTDLPTGLGLMDDQLEAPQDARSQMIDWFIRYIEDAIRAGPSSIPVPKSHKRILSAFQDILNNTTHEPFYTRHCEICIVGFARGKSDPKNQALAGAKPKGAEVEDDAELPDFSAWKARQPRVNIYQLQQVMLIPPLFL